MKTINFSVKEILPSLLNKTKTQTIRPAWDYKNHYLGQYAGMTIKNEKPPRFKVGDQIEIKWTGSHTDLQLTKGFGLHNRTLGTAEITEVFKIEMDKKYIYCYILNGKESITRIETELIAERDGFNSAKQMFEVLDKMYDLSNPKEFWCYRWRWLK